ncbi:Methylpurine-DNA glycosylase [Sesbania bispinosa]|nr:Methylpurine-DNA glycosylase [Sesbania bispinosa]
MYQKLTGSPAHDRISTRPSQNPQALPLHLTSLTVHHLSKGWFLRWLQSLNPAPFNAFSHALPLELLSRDISSSSFGPGGHAYVYLCYGLHMMLNVVADKEGVGAVVLIRSCAPISGLGNSTIGYESLVEATIMAKHKLNPIQQREVAIQALHIAFPKPILSLVSLVHYSLIFTILI